MYCAPVVIEFSVDMDFVVLASFIVQARIIKISDVDLRTLVLSLSIALQSKRGGYNANAVSLLVPSRRYGLDTAFPRHMEREAARYMSTLLSDSGLKTTA